VKVLITGSSGQLGSYLMDELIAGHEVVGLDLRPPGQERHVPLTRIGDVRGPGVLEPFEDINAIIHLAAQVSVDRSLKDPLFDCDVNLTGTVNLLREASSRSIRLFVYVSSAAIYGDPVRLPVDEAHPTEPRSFYGVSKLSAEYYVRAFYRSLGLPFVIIRPFNIYSPRADPSSPYSGVITRFTENAKNGLPLLVEGDGEQTRDFIHAADVARMIRMVLESGVRNQTLNCGTGREISINELAEIVSSLTGVGIVHREARRGDIRRSAAAIRRADELLGFRSCIELKDGIREMLGSMVSQW